VDPFFVGTAFAFAASGLMNHPNSLSAKLAAGQLAFGASMA